MSKPISYTPPALQAAPSGPVRRRHVFYIPGYDPEAKTRYRLLFVRELGLYAKRFGQTKREIGRAVLSPDGLVQSWDVAAHPQTRGADTAYEVLLWDDIVARDFARSRFASVALLFLGTGHMLVTGTLFRLYRLNWKYGNVILYPFVMMTLLAIVAALIAYLLHGFLADRLGLPPWLAIAPAILAGIGCIWAAEAPLNRAFFWQLLNDWVFNWQHGQGWRPDYEKRLDILANHILSRIDAPGAEPPDEYLIVGHSSGALTAVEVAARVLARRGDDPGEAARPPLSLVTLGSGLPLVALQPRARRLRDDIARLIHSRRITWVDYVAPQDWMNFPRFNPVHDLHLETAGEQPAANPLIRSSQFRDIIEAETYRRVRFRPFRMHFQFLMANERPGDYDYFAMVLGPQHLRDRVLWPARTEPAHPATV